MPLHTHVYKLASLFCLNLDFLFITKSIRTLGHLLDQFQLPLPPPTPTSFCSCGTLLDHALSISVAPNTHLFLFLDLSFRSCTFNFSCTSFRLCTCSFSCSSLPPTLIPLSSSWASIRSCTCNFRCSPPPHSSLYVLGPLLGHALAISVAAPTLPIHPFTLLGLFRSSVAASGPTPIPLRSWAFARSCNCNFSCSPYTHPFKFLGLY